MTVGTPAWHVLLAWGSFHGYVCGWCNSLWDDPDDSFAAVVGTGHLEKVRRC